MFGWWKLGARNSNGYTCLMCEARPSYYTRCFACNITICSYFRTHITLCWIAHVAECHPVKFYINAISFASLWISVLGFTLMIALHSIYGVTGWGISVMIGMIGGMATSAITWAISEHVLNAGISKSKHDDTAKRTRERIEMRMRERKERGINSCGRKDNR